MGYTGKTKHFKNNKHFKNLPIFLKIFKMNLLIVRLIQVD